MSALIASGSRQVPESPPCFFSSGQRLRDLSSEIALRFLESGCFSALGPFSPYSVRRLKHELSFPEGRKKGAGRPVLYTGKLHLLYACMPMIQLNSAQSLARQFRGSRIK